LGFKASGADGSEVRNGKKYEWAKDLRVKLSGLDGKKVADITKNILELVNKNGKQWTRLGDGNIGGFNGDGSGIIDISHLVVPINTDNQKVVKLIFALEEEGVGGKLHYDILCD
jgi:hypothetical protein